MSPEKSDAGQEEALDLLEADTVTKSDSTSLDREVEPNSAATGQTKCSICQSTFRRPEHLKRHFRSHTKEKPFECAQCGRHFSRTDTLHRHELSHHTLGADGGKDRTHRITVKTFRACYKCAVARVRCSGGMPCARCESRSLECQYPTERRSKAKLQKNGPSTSSLEKEDTSPRKSSRAFSTPSMHGPEKAQQEDSEHSISQSTGYQIGQFQLQISGLNVTASPNPSAELGPQEHVPPQAENNGTTTLPESTSSLVGPNVTRGSEMIPQAFSSFPGMGPQVYPHIPNAQVQSNISDDQQPTSSYPPGGRQLDIMSSSNSISGIATTANQDEQLAFTQPLLDPSTFAAINWLPNDLFLESANDQGLIPGSSPHHLQSVAFDSSLNHTTWLPPVINTHHPGSSLSGNISQTTSRSISHSDNMSSPGQFSRGLVPESQLQSHPESFKRPTDYSADEQSRRLLKQRRKGSSWLTHSAEPLDIFLKFQNSDLESHFLFPVLHEVKANLSSQIPAKYHIQTSTYDQIYKSFVRLCCTENFLFPKFESENFPSAEALSNFVDLYFHFFDRVYPIFHSPSFDPNRCHWLVTLTLATMGSHSASLCEHNGTIAGFHEFLRRAIFVEKEKCRSDRTPLWFLQVLLLSCIGRLHGRSERGRLSALGDFTDLVNLATRERLLCPDTSSPLSKEASVEQQWILWVEDESHRRTGYLIWLVDSTIAYYFDNRPSFALDDGQAPLPSDERLWQASSAQAWKGRYEDVLGQEKISLYDAVLTLYIEKKPVPETGDFSHTLLVHALYNRMWEVGEYFRRPLSFWTPTAKRQSRKLAIPSGSVWLPGIPSYSKWRNSACDCLDILHWKANDLKAKADGHEHPTVLHLHMARIVLLAPFREIRLLATLLAKGRVDWDDRQQVIEWHYILRWIKHDQYKARLAITHAGSVLWYVRQFSTNAFHEPVAAYLAILTLWAYGLCYNQASPEIAAQASSRRDSSDEPTVINLDQPCDDELVQLFVREGQSMKATLVGVGDICAPRGPEQILRIGCETLAGLSSWGISKDFMVVLMRLADLVS